jgi:hypothetical protein
MRDDLLDAQAAIDWAVAQFKSLDQRLDAWRYENTDVSIEDTDPHGSRKVLLAGQKTTLPRSFNVEAGAYINSIRSSLDLLATTLANRHGIARPNQTYFPVADSYASFAAGTYKGAKFVKALPVADRNIIKSLKPYKGGNELLWCLHYLDIMRKHRRLIPARLRPDNVQIYMQQSFPGAIIFPATRDVRVHDKTVIALIAKDSPQSELQITLEITFDEPGSPIGSKPVVAALYDFASLARSIIDRFDT